MEADIGMVASIIQSKFDLFGLPILGYDLDISNVEELDFYP